jgi:hypothetical protein
MIKPYECTQCGSTDFDDAGPKRVRCVHCGSLFQLLTGEASLVINKGAHVTFGKNANVEIHGDVDIQSGADVDIQGKVSVVRGKKKQQFRLELIPERKPGRRGPA